LLIKPSHTLSSSTRGNSDLDGIVDFLLHKRESDESQDEVHVIEEDGNNDDSNDQVIYLTEQASEQGKSNLCGFIHL
jgi:ribose 1,5-bisphosphokinase PhnN